MLLLPGGLLTEFCLRSHAPGASRSALNVELPQLPAVPSQYGSRFSSGSGGAAAASRSLIAALSFSTDWACASSSIWMAGRRLRPSMRSA